MYLSLYINIEFVVQFWKGLILKLSKCTFSIFLRLNLHIWRQLVDVDVMGHNFWYPQHCSSFMELYLFQFLSVANSNRVKISTYLHWLDKPWNLTYSLLPKVGPKKYRQIWCYNNKKLSTKLSYLCLQLPH